MDMLKKLFPVNAKAGDVTSLIVAIVIYVVAGAVAGLLIGVLSNIPLIGFLFGIVGSLIGLYCLGGIIVSVLTFCKII